AAGMPAGLGQGRAGPEGPAGRRGAGHLRPASRRTGPRTATSGAFLWASVGTGITSARLPWRASRTDRGFGMHRFFQCVGLALLLAPVLSACRPEAGAPSAGEGRDTAQAAAPGTTSATDDAGLELEDVMESDPRYIIGISYPPDIERYPGLAAELKRYADAARGELMDAVRSRDPGDGGGGVLYDLTLSYDVLMDTPAV